MVEIMQNLVSHEDLATWYKLSKELKALKVKESLLRKKIFHGAFPEPNEGTNSLVLTDGYCLKGKYTISRDIDIGSLGALKETLRENKINVDILVNYKPSLVLREYRKLNEEERNLFDQCLIVKPGSPALEIVLPKRS